MPEGRILVGVSGDGRSDELHADGSAVAVRDGHELVLCDALSSIAGNI